jgi:tetratricopeptide (TPR) repeat protein
MNALEYEQLADTLFKEGKYQDAIKNFEQARYMFEVEGSIEDQARIHRKLVLPLSSVPETPMDFIKHSYKFAKKHADKIHLPLVVSNFAVAQKNRGNLEEAERYYGKAKSLFICDPPKSWYHNYGILLKRMGRYSDSLEYLLKSDLELTSVLCDLSQVLVYLESLHATTKIAKGLQDPSPRGKAIFTGIKGMWYKMLFIANGEIEDKVKALQYAQSSLDMFLEMNSPESVEIARQWQCRIKFAVGEDVSKELEERLAYPYLSENDKCQLLLLKTEPPFEEILKCKHPEILGDCHALMGNAQEALKYYKIAFGGYTELHTKVSKLTL